jgi:hypothetical protein
MDRTGAPERETEPVSDQTDLIVGSIRLPSWLGRIPRLAWLFIALAALDGAYRIWDGPWTASGISPTDLASLVLSVVSGAAFVLLPAAILLGGRRIGPAGSWLVQGGIALAAAELVGLIGGRVLDTVAGPDLSGGGLFGASGSLVRSMAVEITVVVLRILGLTRLGLGLRAIAAPARPTGRIQFAAPAAALAVLLFGDLLTIQVAQAAPATAADAIQLAYNLLIVVAAAVVLVLWMWVASLASRHEGRPWRSIMIGAVAIALAQVVSAVGLVVAIQRADTADAQTILTWFGLASGAIGALGTVLLVAGLAQGFEPSEAGDGSETAPGDAPDVGTFNRPAGA